MQIQGHSMSPKLFIPSLEDMIRNQVGNIKKLISMGGNSNNLKYVNDAVFIADNSDDLQIMLEELNLELKKLSLKLNK